MSYGAVIYADVYRSTLAPEKMLHSASRDTLHCNSMLSEALLERNGKSIDKIVRLITY